MKLTMVRTFTPWKLADTSNQGLLSGMLVVETFTIIKNTRDNKCYRRILLLENGKSLAAMLQGITCSADLSLNVIHPVPPTLVLPLAYVS